MGNYNFTLDLKSKNTMSVMNSWIRSNSTVLEFGPANGRLTKYLYEVKNCSVSIVEIDEVAGNEAAQYADESYVGPIYGNIENDYWRQTKKLFDYIIFADVLEHLSDPGEILRKSSELLKQDGNILVSIPNMAHNSILIELYNGKFNYDKTGLLDETHIHFFTHKSFMNLLDGLKLFLYQTELIYSRVGNNEINNSYEDIPCEVALSLRKRNSGSVYQYIYKLGKDKNKENKELKYDEIDKYEDQESTCFWLNDSNKVATKESSVSQIYQGKFENQLIFEFPKKVRINGIRWDPMEHSCLIYIKSCAVELVDGTHLELKYLRSNANCVLDGFFFFDDKDPEIWLSVNGKQAFVSKVLIHFYILKYNLEKISDYSDIYQFIEPSLIKFQNLEREESIHLQTIDQLYKDVAHRENDIAELKSAYRMLNDKCQELTQENEQLYVEFQKNKNYKQRLVEELYNVNLELGSVKEKLEIYRHPIKHIVDCLTKRKGSK